MKKDKIMYSLFMAIFVVSVQFIYTKVFGIENSLIGVIMAIAAVTFMKKSFTTRPLHKGFTILILNLILGVCGYLVSLNIYIGLIINIITIFSVTYLYMNEFSSPTSYIFLMAYIFIWASPIEIYDLPKRLIAISFGVFLIVFLQWIFNRNTLKNKSKTLIIKSLKNIIKELENLKKDKYEYKENIIINQEIREIMTIINSYSYKRFYSSLECKLILSIAISVDRLNIIINEISNKDYDERFINDLQNQLIKISKYLQNQIDQNDLKNSIDTLLNSNKKETEEYKLQVLSILEILNLNIIKLNTITPKDLKIINKEYKLPKEFTKFSKIKRNISLNSLIFTYSIKQAFLISLAMFLSDSLNLTYGKWIVLTMYVIMQPYAEDTIVKSKKRFKGTIIGILLFFTLYSLLETTIPKYMIFLIAFFFYFYYEEYSKKVMCMTIISLVSVTLGENVNILTLTRLINVGIGIIIVLIVNNYIFPYNIEKSIEDLKIKYNKVIELIKIEVERYKYGQLNSEKIIKLILLCNEIESKLILNNKRVKDKSLEVFILKKNIILNDLKKLILEEYYCRKFKFSPTNNKLEAINILINKISNSI